MSVQQVLEATHGYKCEVQQVLGATHGYECEVLVGPGDGVQHKVGGQLLTVHTVQQCPH